MEKWTDESGSPPGGPTRQRPAGVQYMTAADILAEAGLQVAPVPALARLTVTPQQQTRLAEALPNCCGATPCAEHRR